MPPFMRSLDRQTYASLRIVAGLLFLFHGLQLLFRFPTELPGTPSYVTYIAGPIELIGGALVAIGLFASWAAFLCSGLMACAYWMVHAPQELLPIQNKGELAALYCFVFLMISAKGAGIWSVDRARGAE